MSVTIPTNNATEGSGTGSSVSVNLNTGVQQVGDLQVVFIFAGPVYNTPSGWSFVGSVATVGSDNISVFQRVRQSGDPTSQTFSRSSGSGLYNYLMCGFRSTSFLDLSSLYSFQTAASASSTRSINTPAYSANPTGDAMVCFSGGASGDGTTASTSGTTWSALQSLINASNSIYATTAGYKTASNANSATCTTSGSTSGMSCAIALIKVRDGQPPSGLFFGTNF